jgi:Flp pilus assembly protein TadB
LEVIATAPTVPYQVRMRREKERKKGKEREREKRERERKRKRKKKRKRKRKRRKERKKKRKKKKKKRKRTRERERVFCCSLSVYLFVLFCLQVTDKKGVVSIISSASDFPSETEFSVVAEPVVAATIVVPSE